MDRFRLFKWTFLIQELPMLRLEPGSIVSSNLVLIPPHLTLWTLPSHRSGLLFTHHGRYLAKFNLALETSCRSTGKFMSVSVARLFWLDGCYGNESLQCAFSTAVKQSFGMPVSGCGTDCFSKFLPICTCNAVSDGSSCWVLAVHRENQMECQSPGFALAHQRLLWACEERANDWEHLFVGLSVIYHSTFQMYEYNF